MGFCKSVLLCTNGPYIYYGPFCTTVMYAMLGVLSHFLFLCGKRSRISSDGRQILLRSAGLVLKDGDF